MTQLAKCVVERIDSRGRVDEIRDERIVKSDVTRNGGRDVDTGTFWFNGRTRINQNDNVKYIQDIVDTTRLSAIWNFQLTGHDESGYDHDTNSIPEDRFVVPHSQYVTRKRFRSQYALRFETNFNNSNNVEVSDHSRLDMSKQFDLYIWCTYIRDFGGYGFNNRAVIFSKYNNSGEGIEIGFRWRNTTIPLYIRTRDSSGRVRERTGDTSGHSNFEDEIPKLIRIKRDENNVVSCYLDGRLEIQFTDDTRYGRNANIMFGNSRVSTGERWGGLLHQCRLYTGNYLTDLEAERIHISVPQPLTMKLAGKVWKISDNTNPIQVHVKSHSKFLVETNMTSNILTGNTSIRTSNVYNAGVQYHTIINDMITRADSSFTVKNPINSLGNAFDGKFIATGGLIQCIELMIVRNAVFFSTPRKTVIIEREAFDSFTEYDFRQNDATTSVGHIITTSGKDDSLLVNQLEAIGRLKLKHNDITITGINTRRPNSSDETVTIDHHPINIIITDETGRIAKENTDYRVNFEDRQIIFLRNAPFFIRNTVEPLLTHTPIITISYDYEDTDSGEDDQLYYFVRRNNSIREYGLYSRRIILPHFTHRDDIREVTDDIVRANEDVLTRYQVVSAGHVNHMRENMSARLFNPIKGINNTRQVLKSINWKYPLMRTTMQFGEHRFDSFDLEKISSSEIQALGANSKRTQNS